MRKLTTVFLLFLFTLAYAFEKKEDVEGIEIPAVVVTATRQSTATRSSNISQNDTGLTQTINAEQIKDSGAESLTDLLEQQPGLHIEKGVGGDSISMQGLGAQYVMILVDGERIAGRINGAIDLSRFSTENIERVEIVRGAGSSLYGSEALGGVINIITKQTLTPGYNALAKLSYGSFGQLHSNNTFDYSSGAWGISLFGGYHQRDSYDLNPSNLTTDGSQFYKFNFGPKVSYRFSNDNNITLRAEYIQQRSDGIEQSGTGAIYDRINLTEIAQSSFSQNLTWGASRFQYKLNHSFFKDQFAYDQRFDSANDLLQKTIDQIGEANFKYEYAGIKNHYLIGGIDNTVEHLATPRLQDGSARRFRSGIFLQDEWTISESLNFILVPGLRYDFDTLFDQNFSPKLAAKIDLHKSLAVKGSYAWGFRAPDFRQMHLLFENLSVGYVVEGNPNLKAEQSVNINAGFDWQVTKNFFFQTSFFHNKLKNLISTELMQAGSATNMTRYVYMNISEAKTQGVEMMMSLEEKFRALSLSFNVGYTYTDTLDLRYNLPLTLRPKHLGSLSADVDFTNWGLKLSSRLKFTGSRQHNISTTSTPEQISSDPYIILDSQIQWNLSAINPSLRGMSMFCRGENLLNSGEETYLPLMPASANCGLSVQLDSIKNKE